MKKDCIFCNIANNLMEAAVVFENSEFKVILDAFPAAKGHTLIVPRNHVETIYDLDTDQAGRLFVLASEVARAIKSTYNCDGLNVVQNNGAAAGQTVNHFHLHLIPRFENDGIDFQWTAKKFTLDELKEVAKEIGNKI